MSDICFYLTHYPMCKGYKFAFLADKLRESNFSVETVLCSTEVTGIQPGDFTEDELQSMHNTRIMSKNDMKKYVSKNSFKYFVVGTYSGDIQDILKIVRKNGAVVIEIATLGFNDPIEHYADINLLISKLGFKAALNKCPGRAKKAKKRIYVGSLLADDIPNIYTSSLRSIEDFKRKYSITQDRVFIWLPGREDLHNYELQQRLVKGLKSHVCILAKPHPWSYKLNKDIIKNVSVYMKIIDPRDAYWGLKTMDAAISINSTVGIELAVLKKPIIYLQHVSRRPFINKEVVAVGFVAKSVKDIFYLTNEGNLFIHDDKYNQYLNKVYPAPFKPAYDRICDFFKEQLI